MDLLTIYENGKSEKNASKWRIIFMIKEVLLLKEAKHEIVRTNLELQHSKMTISYNNELCTLKIENWMFLVILTFSNSKCARNKKENKMYQSKQIIFQIKDFFLLKLNNYLLLIEKMKH